MGLANELDVEDGRKGKVKHQTSFWLQALTCTNIDLYIGDTYA